MDGPPPPEEDFSQLPLSDRLAHKNWKARVSAYEELVKVFSLSASEGHRNIMANASYMKSEALVLDISL